MYDAPLTCIIIKNSVAHQILPLLFCFHLAEPPPGKSCGPKAESVRRTLSPHALFSFITLCVAHCMHSLMFLHQLLPFPLLSRVFSQSSDLNQHEGWQSTSALRHAGPCCRGKKTRNAKMVQTLKH